ncbi:MAG: DNA-binding response regulator [Bacteroidetes bacterium HGW-Bacteroidetes-21]|jgi:DNA-binding response OmpR family regulator|nr:MAG: DNA-binding response regulator [Bacteroidetes bacterium HGW-Bacteroidetes-21]
MKILLIEDEHVLAESISKFLTQEGFLCELAKTYESGIEKVCIYDYDCVLVDITLPDGNGLQILKKLKEIKPNTGVIIISAKNSLDDKLTGLDLGADDYLTKPFHLAELNSRIKSLIRRRKFEGKCDILFEEIRIIPESQTVFIQQHEVKLTRKEYELLLFFIVNKNRTISRESLAEHIWGDDADLSDSFDFLYSHIKNVRKKIEEAGGLNYIQTVYGIGYKFSTT